MFRLGISHIVNPTQLAKRVVARSLMASSYDRRGGNHDWSNYLRLEGRSAVMMEADGPGCITRFWVADPQKGMVHVLIDGQHAIECKLADLFGHLPLSHGIGGESPENYARSKAEQVPMGFTSYCPIPFERHCKILVEPEDDYLYYQINYHLLPPGTGIESFSLSRSVDTEDIRSARKIIDEWKGGKPLVDMSQARKQAIHLEAGTEASILEHKGAGVIRGIRIRIGADLSGREREHVRENLWLVAHFDDDEPRDASVRAPLGPLCLDYGQDPAARSLFVGSDSEGYYCFFAMPYYQGAHLRLVNKSILPAKVEVSVLHEESAPEPDLLRFRATWHVETPFGPDHRDYEGLACRLLNLDGFNNVEMLNVWGAGHFVGCGFEIDLREAPTDRAAGEGDEIFFIDDDPRLTMNGTGTEDYLNDAWGIRGYVGPLSGDAVGGEFGRDPRIFGYRLHVPDPVPFTRHGRFTLEHGTGNNCSGLYRSVAYWYMDPSLTRTRTEEWRWEEIRTGKRKMNQE